MSALDAADLREIIREAVDQRLTELGFIDERKEPVLLVEDVERTARNAAAELVEDLLNSGKDQDVQ